MTPEELAAATANPGDALPGLRRLFEARPGLAEEAQTALPLAHVFSGSGYLADWLLSRPEEIDWILDSGGLTAPHPRAAMAANLAALLNDHDPMTALRRFKHRELIRVCAGELSGAVAFVESMEEWTAVAELCVDAAVNIAEAEALERYGEPVYTELTDDVEKVARFAVIGMGKLGGRELNISSDIDVMYVHSSDNGTTTGDKKIPLHEHFVRIARRVTRLLNEVTEEGFVFRVDLDLRPEGQAGEITNSIGAMEIYYESWGRQWERQALIKARHCGGAEEVSAETLYRLRPFVYRKYMDESALKEIGAIKAKIDQSLASRKSARDGADNIKLGRGGIREVEFTVQALQLLYGARYAELQTHSTLKGLDACDAHGFLSTPHYRDLKDAYLFYRKLENRLQYARNIQTHNLPKDKDRRAAMGRLMGLANGDPAAALAEEVKRRRKRVRAIFDLFFVPKEKPDTEAFPVPIDDEVAVGEWLDSLHFDHPETSARALALLRNGSSFSHPSERSRLAFDRFGPGLVSEAAATAWPDHVILGFSNFVEARGGRDMLYELLDSNRQVIKMLSAIFSSSESLTEALLRQPDLLDRLLVADPVGRPADRKVYEKEFRAAIGAGRTGEERITLINSFRTAETLRLGLRRILELAGRFELMRGLTALAEEHLRALARLAWDELDMAGERPEDVRWTLIAAGKLGRREMNFGSDIDLLVFYEGGPDPAAARDNVTRLMQSIIRLSVKSTPYGAGYQIDMRLRPEGDAGPLVTSFETMEEYYRTRGRTWERLALVGARPVAGNRELGEKVTNIMKAFITSAPPTPLEAEQIMNIREKIASQRVKPGVMDIKFGKGGLMELEFICQWLAMEHPELLGQTGPYIVSTLAAAGKNGWLGKRVGRQLENAYHFYRSIEETLRMDREQAVNVIPRGDTTLLRRLARAVEQPQRGPGGIIERVRATMTVVRKLYLDFFTRRAEPAVPEEPDHD